MMHLFFRPLFFLSLRVAAFIIPLSSAGVLEVSENVLPANGDRTPYPDGQPPHYVPESHMIGEAVATQEWEAPFGFIPRAEEWPLNHTTRLTLAYVDFPPYEYEEDGEAKGILVEIVKELFHRADIQLTLVHMSFPRAYKEVEEGRIDGLFNFYKTVSRMERFDYSAPLIMNPLMYFVRENFPFRIDNLEDLRGLWVGVTEGYSYGDPFDHSAHFKKDVAASHASNLKKLADGRIDVYPVDKLVGIYTAHRLGLTHAFNILPDPLIVMEGHIGFTKNNHEQLITKLDEIISDMRESGRIEAIKRAYLERVEQRENMRSPLTR